MALLLFKIIACSSLLFLFYQLFLAREKTFIFNRIFLLSSLIFAYSIPFIAFNAPNFRQSKSNLIFGEVIPTFQAAPTSTPSSFNWENVFFTIYILISLLFLMKFIYSFTKIIFLRGEKRIYKNQKIKILDQNVPPFSFFNTIYISRKHLENNQIDERIFLHEKCHIEQKHSIDILFLEILKIVSWFNPILFFYKKEMINNHEFMADEYVLNKNFDVRNYQYLILNEMKSAQIFTLTHQFNFNETKKRFIMMTAKTTKFTGIKKLALLPVLAILFVFFTKNANAQKTIEKAENNSNNEIEKVAIPLTEIATIKPAEQHISSDEDRIEIPETRIDTIREKTNREVSPAASVPSTPPNAKEPVDILPTYPGGVSEFRSLINTNFNTSIFTGGEGLMKTIVHFIIDENGNVSDFTAEGNNEKFNQEALRSIKVSSQEKTWTPAMKDGKNVKYEFKMPLTMHFAK